MKTNKNEKESKCVTSIYVYKTIYFNLFILFYCDKISSTYFICESSKRNKGEERGEILQLKNHEKIVRLQRYFIFTFFIFNFNVKTRKNVLRVLEKKLIKFSKLFSCRYKVKEI